MSTDIKGMGDSLAKVSELAASQRKAKHTAACRKLGK